MTKIELRHKVGCVLYAPPNAMGAQSIELVRLDGSAYLSPEMGQAIDAHWQKAKNNNGKIFNGILLNLKRVESARGTLRVIASRTDYKTYSYFQQQPTYRLFDHGIAAIGTSSLLLTKDNKVILALRGRGLAGERNVHSIPGGLLDQHYSSFTDQVMAELHEELGVRREDVLSVQFHGIGYDSVFGKGAEFLFSITTSLTAAEVTERQAQAPDAAEAAEVFAVEIPQLPKYVRTNRARIMEGSLANLLTFLNHNKIPGIIASWNHT